MNLMNNVGISNNFLIPQRREIVLCLSDLIMDTNITAVTIKKIVKLIYKEAKRLRRHDVIENLNLHCLIG